MFEPIPIPQLGIPVLIETRSKTAAVSKIKELLGTTAIFATTIRISGTTIPTLGIPTPEATPGATPLLPDQVIQVQSEARAEISVPAGAVGAAAVEEAEVKLKPVNH